MSFKINDFVQRNENYKQLRTEGLKKARKWEKLGLLENLNSEERITMATLIDNQAQQLLMEASSTGNSPHSEEWSSVALPLVRRVFGNISAKNFVSVQPMTLPSGLVFWLEFKYGTSKSGFVAGSGKDSELDSVFGVTNTEGDPYGGLYGEGRFGYSLNNVTSDSLTYSGSVAEAKFSTASIVANDYNHDTRFSSSYAGQFGATDHINIINVSADSIPDFDPYGVSSFGISGSNISDYFPQYTKLSADKSVVRFFVSGTGNYSGVKVTYHKQPKDYDRGDFEYKGDALDIPELNMEMRSEPVVAKTRKLKAIWGPELAQDLNAYHSIDAEAELTKMMADYIGQEIDLSILSMLLGAAKNVDYWNAQVGKVYDSGTKGFVDMSTISAQASAYTQGEWFKTLGTKIQKVSNKIHQKTMRGGANWLVVSPEIATILESIPGYSADTNGDREQFSFGSEKIGMINNRYQVYKSPYMTTNLLLMGYKGSGLFEAGAAYLPYIPLITSPVIYDPVDAKPIKHIMTRSAQKVTRGEYFGVIKIGGLNTL